LLKVAKYFAKALSLIPFYDRAVCTLRGFLFHILSTSEEKEFTFPVHRMHTQDPTSHDSVVEGRHPTEGNHSSVVKDCFTDYFSGNILSGELHITILRRERVASAELAAAELAAAEVSKQKEIERTLAEASDAASSLAAQENSTAAKHAQSRFNMDNITQRIVRGRSIPAPRMSKAELLAVLSSKQDSVRTRPVNNFVPVFRYKLKKPPLVPTLLAASLTRESDFSQFEGVR
jgi:hypothetical protein